MLSRRCMRNMVSSGTEGINCSYTDRMKGPIVRINPNETHCADMAFSDEIYAVGGRKRDKPFHQVNGSAAGTGNAFGTPDHDLHRARRAPVAKFFSRAM